MLDEQAKQRLKQSLDNIGPERPGIFSNVPYVVLGALKLVGLALLGVAAVVLSCWLVVFLCTLIYNGSVWLIERVSAWFPYDSRPPRPWTPTDWIVFAIFLYLGSRTNRSKKEVKA